MTTEPLDDPRMRERIARLRAALDATPAPTRPTDGGGVSGPLLLSIESSCDETGIALVEGGRRIISQRRRLAGRPPRPVGRDRARGRGAGPPALDRAGPRRGLGRSRRRRGRTSTGSPSPTVRAWPARCSSASTSPRPSPGSTTRRSSRSTTWRATSTPAGCWTPGEDEASRPEPIFPLVALVVSGGHTFLAEMRDHLTYRLLGHDRGRRRGRGVRQGRAAPGSGLSRAGRRSRRPPRARSATTSASPGRGWATRTTGASPASRRPPARSWPRHALAEGLAVDDPGRAALRGVRRRTRLGVPGRRRRRPRDQDDPGGSSGRCAVHHPGWRGRREQRPAGSTARARPRPWACRSSCRDRACARTTGR